MNKFEQEIIESLRGKIKVTEKSDGYFNFLEENYPIGLNRINWSKVANHRLLILSGDKDRLVKILKFLNEIVEDCNIDKYDEIVVWGDQTIDNAYTLNIEDFLTSFQLFFDLPQHTYGWFKKIDKIINYTFEDELYFG